MAGGKLISTGVEFPDASIQTVAVPITLTDTSNLGLGTGAVDSITTGDYNVGVGDNALTSVTTGNYNTALGKDALYSNTTGANNTASGYYSLYSNTTGTENVAVGRSALRANTTASYNTAMGYNSLSANTTASNNTAVGYNSLSLTTTGNYNSAFGSSALSQNDTGASNTALGIDSLSLNTTGSFNVAVGGNSLDANTTASNNTAVGYASLGANTTGANNTALGYLAGDNITTGSSNIIIGSSIDAPSATASNQLNIGNWIKGVDGNIGIGVTPEAWHSSYTALQFAGNGALSGWGNQQAGAAVFLSQNASVDQTNDWEYISTDEASRYEQVNGVHTFSVAPSGAADSAITWTTAMTITNDGNVGIGSSGLTSYKFIVQNSADQTAHLTYASNAAYTKPLSQWDTYRSGSSAFRYVLARSNVGGAIDNEFKLNGDGNAYADGSWNGGGADYAEYFEWADGNALNEDRRGISVVLDGDKIRPAVEGESPIGVISARPAMVGDNDMDKWKQKHLRSDFGDYILEEHTVTEWEAEEANEDGELSIVTKSFESDRIPADETVPSDAVVSTTDDNGNVFKRRTLNPDWNPDTEYVSREDRKEWDTVGLMGKLRVLKGQPVDARWIKMRDVSDTVEEWLVR